MVGAKKRLKKFVIILKIATISSPVPAMFYMEGNNAIRSIFRWFFQSLKSEILKRVYVTLKLAQAMFFLSQVLKISINALFLGSANSKGLSFAHVYYDFIERSLFTSWRGREDEAIYD